jgi:hypothetical protein
MREIGNKNRKTLPQRDRCEEEVLRLPSNSSKITKEVDSGTTRYLIEPHDNRHRIPNCEKRC